MGCVRQGQLPCLAERVGECPHLLSEDPGRVR